MRPSTARAAQRFLGALVAAFVLLLGGPAARAAEAPTGPAADACKALLKQNFLDIPDAPTSLISATVVPATDTLPAYCQVVGTIAPQVGFEVGLPLAEWNGRLMMQGCGGTCGIHALWGCEDMLARHFAVVHTDMGHAGKPITGGLWAEGNLPAVIDFGYRATHVAIVSAKVIQQAFYGRAADYSYFRGCSTGGRQAMVEAERFPEDFDGIVSIAPPLDETGVTAMHLVWSARAATTQDGRKIIDADDVRRVHAAAVAACDGGDGVMDGVIGNPMACKWRVADLRCVAGRETAGCLSDEKVAAFQKMYDGVRDARGQRPYPGGFEPGSELTWLEYFVSPTAEPAKLLDPAWIVGDFLRYLAFWQSPGAFGVYDFDYARDTPRLALTEAIYTATNPDLRRFKAHSGKLILVGGLADPLIPVPSLIDYYQTVTNLMGGTAQTRDFFRLYLVPGMEHCVGGVGPDAIDHMAALQDWVEHGRAPDALVGAHLAKPQSMLRYERHPLAAGKAEWNRPVYAYPDAAVWNGKGDWHDAANWKRVAAPR